MTHSEDRTAAQSPSPSQATRVWLVDATRRLFRPAVAPWTTRNWAVALAAVVVGAIVSMARGPFGITVNTVWAEDGSVFLADGEHFGLASLFRPYGGYFNVVPRLLGTFAAAFPLSAAAWILAVCSALVTSLLALLVYRCAEGHFDSAFARLLVAAPVILLPLGQGEILNSIANLQWPGLYALFWVLVWVPAGRLGRIAGVLTVILVGLSDILVIALVPLAIVRVFVRRDGYGRLLAGVLAACVVVQASNVLLGTSSRQVSSDVVRWPLFYILRAVPAALFGEQLAPFESLNGAVVARAAVAWLCIAAVVALALRRFTRPDWQLAIAAALCSVALYGLPVALSGVATARYAAAPAMLLIVTLAALLKPDPPRAESSPAHSAAAPARTGIAMAVFGAVCVAVWAVNFHVDVPRDRGPLWSDEIQQAELRCAAGGSATDIAIAPDDGYWVVHVGCPILATYGR